MGKVGAGISGEMSHIRVKKIAGHKIAIFTRLSVH